MHGQKRNEYKMKTRDPILAAKLQSKASQWFHLSGLIVSVTTKNNKDRLDLLSKLVLVNPDPMYLWNHRRDILLAELPPPQQLENPKSDTTADTDTTATTTTMLDEELALTQQCLGRNPKAYSVWFHRKWLMGTYCHTDQNRIHNELDLTTQFLLLDERNFHCWNYRRFIIGIHGAAILGDSSSGGGGEWTWWTTKTTTATTVMMGSQVGHSPSAKLEENNYNISEEQREQLQSLIQSEFTFTTTKINENFSNGSAFHYRSKLLPYIIMQHQSIIGDNYTPTIIQQELELIHSAIFTEPDDQTAWWYLEYLLSQGLLSQDQLVAEKEMLQELVADEKESKWVWLGLYNVLSRMEENQDGVMECLDRLIELDLDRRTRYERLRRDAISSAP